MYDPINGPDNNMEIDLVGELPNSNDFTYKLTATEVSVRYLNSSPLYKPGSSSVVKALVHIFTQHAYVPRHILIDKGSTFPSQVKKELMDAIG